MRERKLMPFTTSPLAGIEKAQSTRERKTNGRRSGLSCKDQTLFRSMGALVGKNSKHMGFSKSSGTIHYGVLAGSTGKDCRRCPLNSHYRIIQ